MLILSDFFYFTSKKYNYDKIIFHQSSLSYLSLNSARYCGGLINYSNKHNDSKHLMKQNTLILVTAL